MSGSLEKMNFSYKGKSSRENVNGSKSIIYKRGTLRSACWLFPCVDLFSVAYHFSLIRITVPEGYSALSSGVLVNEFNLPIITRNKVKKSKINFDNYLNDSNHNLIENDLEEISLSKRDFNNFQGEKKDKSNTQKWNIFEYQINRLTNPSHIGFVVGPFSRIKSNNFVDEIWYLPNNFENEKEVLDICDQYAKYEDRIFDANPIFNSKHMEKSRQKMELKSGELPIIPEETNNGNEDESEKFESKEILTLILIPGVFVIDSTNLRDSLRIPKTECLFHSNMFILSEEIYLDDKHLELFHVGLGLAIKYKFLSYFVRNVTLKSPNGIA
jgi:hypothetical protein